MERHSYDTAEGAIDDYYVVYRQDFVLVVAVAADGVVLIEQYRPATDQWYWCLPAGYVDPGEDLVSAAHRELLEETGLTALDGQCVAVLDPLPAYLRSRAHVVLCERVSGLPAPRSGAGELIRDVRPVGWSEILDWIAAGRLCEMQAVAALLLAWHRLQGARRV